ncbi:hypothetical protein Mame01_53560 [Microbispora amethystogenes]|nr:hypothetical protein Mame01_53560 [Microbispora amethystogenes]
MVIKIALKKLVEVESTSVHDLTHGRKALCQLPLGITGVRTEPRLCHDVLNFPGWGRKAAPRTLNPVAVGDARTKTVHIT